MKLILWMLVFFFNVSFVVAQTIGDSIQQGNDFFKQGLFDLAVIEYTKAIDANPNLASPYNNRGVAYAKSGSLDRAIADFTMAIANDAKDAEAYSNRGHAYADKGDLSQAVTDYTSAIKINRFYVKAYNNRALVFYMLKEYDKAWQDVNTVKAINGDTDPKFIDMLKKASSKINDN